MHFSKGISPKRTNSTHAYVALHLKLEELKKKKTVNTLPIMPLHDFSSIFHFPPEIILCILRLFGEVFIGNSASKKCERNKGDQVQSPTTWNQGFPFRVSTPHEHAWWVLHCDDFSMHGKPRRGKKK